MHFFQTADAVEMALGKDISQSGATFYPIYSDTSKNISHTIFPSLGGWPALKVRKKVEDRHTSLR